MKNCIECNDRFKCDYYMHDYAGCNDLYRLKKYCEKEEELVEVVHAKWIDTQPEYHNGYYRNAHVCSNCHDYYTTEPEDLFFCPRCGAKMDLT